MRNLLIKKGSGKMPTYTVTAELHVEFDGDESDMLDFVGTMMPAHSGVHFIQFRDVEQD